MVDVMVEVVFDCLFQFVVFDWLVLGFFYQYGGGVDEVWCVIVVLEGELVDEFLLDWVQFVDVVVFVVLGMVFDGVNFFVVEVVCVGDVGVYFFVGVVWIVDDYYVGMVDVLVIVQV